MILADENIVCAVVERLRVDGLDVVYIAEIAPSIEDADVLARATRVAPHGSGGTDAWPPRHPPGYPGE